MAKKTLLEKKKTNRISRQNCLALSSVKHRENYWGIGGTGTSVKGVLPQSFMPQRSGSKIVKL